MQSREAGRVGGQWASALLAALPGQLAVDVEPDHAMARELCAHRLAHDRATAERDHAVTGRAQQLERDLLLGVSEGRLAVASKQRRHRGAETLLDDLVDIRGAHAQVPRERTHGGRLARAHEADEHDLGPLGPGHSRLGAGLGPERVQLRRHSIRSS